jgi:MFS family permease
LLGARVLLGIGEGVNFPAIHSLAARWAPARERSRALALSYTGIFLGTIAALLGSPPLILRYGWPAVFYVSGALGALWLTAWALKGGNGPEDARGISAAELDLIVSDRPSLARPQSIPWAAILRERAVWAIVLAHVCNNWGFYILLLWLPTYLHRALHVPVERVGQYSLIPWAATFVVGNFAGWLSDWMLACGLPVTAVRKIMQTAGFALGAIPLFFLPGITNPALALSLVTVSACCGAMSLAAFGVNHLDVGPRYAGVLMGISNTAATVPGIIGVAATGFILGVTGSFSAIFYLTAVIYLLGLAAYLAWASGERKL